MPACQFVAGNVTNLWICMKSYIWDPRHPDYTVSTIYSYFLTNPDFSVGKIVQTSLKHSAWLSLLFWRHHSHKFAICVDVGLNSWFIKLSFVSDFLYLAHQTGYIVRHKQNVSLETCKFKFIIYSWVSLITIIL